MKLTYYVIEDRPPDFILAQSGLNDKWRGANIGTKFDIGVRQPLSFWVFANDPDDTELGDGVWIMSCSGLPTGAVCEFHNDEVDGDGLGWSEGYVRVDWVPQESDIGTHLLLFKAEDSPGYLCDGSTYPRQHRYLSVTINVAAHPPTVVTVPPDSFTVNTSQELTFEVNATDSVDNVVGITVENLPNNAIFLGGGGSAPAHGVFTWTPGPSDYRPNPYIVNFTATDEAGNQGHVRVSIQVEDAPPKITTPSNGQSFTWSTDRLWVLSVEATDPDGSVVSITATGQPPGSDFKESTPGSATLSWWPGPGDGGSYPVTFTARDNAGLTDQVSVTIIVDALRFVEPPAGYRFLGTENTLLQSPQKTVMFSVNAVGPPGCTISLAMITSPGLPPAENGGPSFTWTAGNPADGQFFWTPEIGSAGEYTVTFTASAAGFSPVTRSVIVRIDANMEDTDGDGIPDVMDKDPANFSNDFQWGTLSGTIQSRGDQEVSLTAVGDNMVVVRTAATGGTNPALINSSGGRGLVSLDAGEGALLWSGSAGVKAVSGSVDVDFSDVAGQHAFVTLNQDNSLTFKPAPFSFAAPPTNTGTTTVKIIGTDYPVSPGTTLVFRRGELVGTWESQGVYCQNSETKGWQNLASPATLIACGDLDCDGIDDLVGIWPDQGGVWLKSSLAGSWTLLGSTARHIATGDMSGDGWVDLLGTWDGQGVYYRDSATGEWVHLASEADQVTCGDLDGDGIDDLIGLWPSQGGVWVKYSKDGSWARLSSAALDIAAGDMNGDGRVDLLGTWDGQGVFYRDSVTGEWVMMASQADQVTCGDLDGDGIDDLIGLWPSQGGVWVKYSKDGTWETLSSTALDIASGRMRELGGAIPGLLSALELPQPGGGREPGPSTSLKKRDLSDRGPGGRRFVWREEKNLTPKEESAEAINKTPGPGEPGFRPAAQNNLEPREAAGKKREQPARKKSGKGETKNRARKR